MYSYIYVVCMYVCAEQISFDKNKINFNFNCIIGFENYYQSNVATGYALCNASCHLHRPLKRGRAAPLRRSLESISQFLIFFKLKAWR